ncbi:MAG TPA: thioredoxin domain-containing protein [Longimicrobiales bacterium]|nr:thioredoxin domain-containing protein [Longimicrobiales bacterium]
MPARSKKAAQGGPNLKAFYWILGVVAAVGLGAIAWSAMRSGDAVNEPIELPPEALNNPQQLVATATPVVAGSNSAPVQLLVFSDFTCPSCRHYTQNVEVPLRAEYIEKNQVQVKYYDFPLGGGGQHRWGFLAARASRCAGDQNKFWEYHDMLFSRQQEWSYRSSSPTSDFEGYAGQLGLDQRAFQQCLNSDKHANVVTANRALGEQLRVSGTPTLFMNGRPLPEEWSDYGKLKARIQEALGPAAASSTAQ